METICDCGHTVKSDGLGTGYGINDKNEKICYQCCADQDKAYLKEHGTLTGYFDGKYFTNWPGSFKLLAQGIKKSWHNFAGRDGRTDYWVYMDGVCYHGVHVGFTHQCSTIRKVKQ